MIPFEINWKICYFLKSTNKMTINNINLNNLLTYSGKTTRSFEQLLYSLMKKEFGHLGKFTPIAGDGGDSGIEFYLDLYTGERWGWQCKCYDDNGRLNYSSRFKSIESSLETACTNHSNLTKWFLCLRTNLTINLITKTGKVKKGERTWFDKTLPLKIPTDRTIILEFIGEDEIIDLIGDVKNIGIRNFFFGELEVNQQWFKDKFEDSFEQVKSKYEPQLHTMDSYTQSIVDFKLINPEYTVLVDSQIGKLNLTEKEIDDQIKRFLIESTHKEKEVKEKGAQFISEYGAHKSCAYEILENLKTNIIEYDIQALKDLNFISSYGVFDKYLERFDQFVFYADGAIYRSLREIYYLIKNFFEDLKRFTRNYIHTLDNEIHFIAKPAEGKTHTCCDIIYKRMERGLPAIFFTGNKFNHEIDLEQTILRRLNIPAFYSLEDVLSAINIYGSLIKIRIPIIIDGLNETIHNKLFSSIWRTHLPALINKVKRFPNLCLITTCRESYKKEVWVDYDSVSFQYLRGFNDFEVTKEAIRKYFNRYLIKADLNFSNLESFRKPIFLKLYCEIKNPYWSLGREVEVVIDDDSSNNLFSTYFQQINKDIALTSHHLIRRNESFIQINLEKIAKYLWENNTREIEVEKYYEIIDGKGFYNAEVSRANILINEGLIITRDYRDNGEYISITYELMSGYLIAKYLTDNYLEYYFEPGKEFHQKIVEVNKRHPLFENITEELALIFPKYKQKKLHDLYSLIDDSYIHSVSVKALWKLHPELIYDKDIHLVQNYFRNVVKNRKNIFRFCQDTITSTTHPFNTTFLSNELLKLDVWERDLYWTEYVRESSYRMKMYVEDFEYQCKEGNFESQISVCKIHLAAEYIQWFLVSTNRQLRDFATRALYYYGRRFPKNFVHLTIHSLKCNDPYLWERTLAALYGICMALHQDESFQNSCLLMIGTSLYNAMFIQNATHFTTHILARDYARGCIRIALLFKPELLTDEQIERLNPPYQFNEAAPPEVEDGENLTYKAPLGMDFSNYTIGSIVKGGHSYANPPEKQIVRRQILYRVEELGWSEERFKLLDDGLGGHLNRNERPAVERYGKKYSRIAFYEIAGYRDDKGLLIKDLQHYRILSTDLDPSFPEEVKTENFIRKDILGDSSISLQEWINSRDIPDIEEYLKYTLTDNKQFVCIDGFVTQNNEQANRSCFMFIRSFMVSEKDYSDLLPMLKKQNLKERWLPEKHENSEAFSGEIYLFDEATYSNNTTLEFILSSVSKKVKKGDEGYVPEFKIKKTKKGISFGPTYPKFVTITVDEKRVFKVLMPVMDYHGPSDNEDINNVSTTTILAKEIVMDLGLIGKAQTFDLFDRNGAVASVNLNYYENSDNTHNMVFLRKDLLDKYLERNKLKFIWVVWGERESSFSYRRTVDFDDDERARNYGVFDNIIEYKQ